VNRRPRPLDEIAGTEHVPLPDVRRMPGREALLMGALTTGLLMLGIQLWLLTVALEMYLSGEGGNIWSLALASGLVFAGGLAAVWLLSRRPRI
jgi:hypothetical protein